MCSRVFYDAVCGMPRNSTDIVVFLFKLVPGAGKRARCSSLTTLLNMKCGKRRIATGSSSLWMCGTQSSARCKDRRSPLYRGQKVTLRLSLHDAEFSQSQTVSLTIYLESSEPESITICVRKHLSKSWVELKLLQVCGTDMNVSVNRNISINISLSLMKINVAAPP